MSQQATQDYDSVNPYHYVGNGEIECKDAMRSMLYGWKHGWKTMGAEATYWIMCAFKYIWRAPLKNGTQDLEKAHRCIEYALEAIADGEDAESKGQGRRA